jgi:hypothetical protein
MTINLHAFLTVALDWWTWLASCYYHFTPRSSSPNQPCHLDRWLGRAREISAPGGNLMPISGSSVPRTHYYTDRALSASVQFFCYCCYVTWNLSGLAQDTVLNIAVNWTLLLIVFSRCRFQILSQRPAILTEDFRAFPYSLQKTSVNITSD